MAVVLMETVGRVTQPAGAPSSRLITVVCGARRLDLDVPTGLPVGDLLATLVPLLAPRGGDVTGPRQWELAPVAGAAMAAGTTLADGDVRDGDILVLSDRPARPPRPGAVADVRATVEARGDSGRWTAGAAATFFAWLLGLASVALVPTAAVVVDLESLTVVAAAGALTLGATALAVRVIAPAGSLVALSAAAGWAAIAAVAAGRRWEWPTLGLSLAALAAAFLIGVLASPLIPRAAALSIATLVVALGVGLVAAGAVAGVTALTAARGLGLAATCCVGAVPRSAVAIAGLLAADERHRRGRSVGAPEIDRAARRAENAVSGLLAGLGACAALAAWVLSVSTSGWDVALAGLLGATLAARSRLTSRGSHVITLWLAGLIALGAAALGVGLRAPALTPVLMAGALVSGCVAVVAAVASRHWTLATKGRLAQAAGIADRILPAAALVVAAGGFGLYDWVGAVTAGLG